MRRRGLVLLAAALPSWLFAVPLERRLRAEPKDGPGRYVICAKAPVIVAQGEAPKALRFALWR